MGCLQSEVSVRVREKENENIAYSEHLEEKPLEERLDLKKGH